MELNHQVMLPGTGFEAALHTVALSSLAQWWRRWSRMQDSNPLRLLT